MAWHPLGWVPAFFSEIDKFPSAVLAHHYGSNMPGEPLAKNGIPNYGDFTEIGAEAGPVDLLVGGTPCQSFSVAGKRLGLDDPRGNLALEYLSLARRLRARWIVWENVPGVLSSYSGSEQAAREVHEGPVGGEGIGIEDRDFAMFLSFVRECGYGFAYRVLDAQYIRVDGLARAVPQRRERVFLVGYLGDWRRAAAVLLEPEGMRGDSAPRRQAGQRPAPTISSRPTGGGGLGTDFDLDGGLVHAEVAATLPAGGNATGGARQPGMGAETAATMLIAFAQNQRDEVREVPVAGALAAEPGMKQQTYLAHAIQAGALRENPLSGPDGVGVQANVAYTVEARSEVQAVAFGGDVARSLTARHDSSPCADRGMDIVATSAWAVRRLMPVECERLQGFPDNFTNVPWRGKEHAPDGPRYKALGNSMAVNAMRWIGQRIDIMEKLIKEGRIAA